MMQIRRSFRWITALGGYAEELRIEVMVRGDRRHGRVNIQRGVCRVCAWAVVIVVCCVVVRKRGEATERR